MKCNTSGFRFFGKGILYGIVALVFAAAIAFLFGWVLMLLWNWLMPAIFGLTTISYLQAWGLILLSHLLFKGGGPGGHHPPRPHRHDSGHGGHLFGPGEYHAHHTREEMDSFKKEFRDRMKRHWHGDSYDDGCCGGCSDSKEGEGKSSEEEDKKD